jgi:multidrug efflux pump subunit AcrA (membrane-fusion protein)
MRPSLKAIFLTITFNAFAACTKEAPTTTKTDGPVVVKAFKVEKKFIEEQIVLSGSVEAKSILELPSFGEGIVKECFVKVGSKVAAGTKLCRVENDNPGETFLPYEMESPVAGVVAQFFISPGERIAKGAKLLSLVTSNEIKMILEATAEQVNSLKVGMSGTWTAIQSSEQTTNVVIKSISPVADPVTKTFQVELTPVSNGKQISWALGKASFKLRSVEGIEVPEKATTYIGETPQVRLLIDSKVKFAPVKLGKIRQDKVEILEGLVGNETIVLTTPRYLADGETVIIEAETNAKGK